MSAKTTSRLTSGQWTGFLNSHSEPRKSFDLLLRFANGRISGVGNDENGMFVLSGEMDTADNECRWVLTYLFGETVFYRGFCENRRIWGTWESGQHQHGGFEIRPARHVQPPVPR